MKKLLTIISSIFIFSCASYSQHKKKVYDCVIKDTITQEDKYLGVDKYTDELNKEKSVRYLLNDSIEISTSIYKNEGIITKRMFNKNTNIVKAVNYEYNSKSIVSYNFYYKKGILLIGKEYHYDTSGNMTKIINNDNPENYTLCYKEAEAIVLKKMGKKYEIDSVHRENKVNENVKIYYWVVIASKIGSNKYSDSRELWLDSKTGKIIKVLKMSVSTDDYFP